MTSVLAVPAPAEGPTPSSTEGRLLLHGISWATYENLLHDYQDQSAPRLTYDKGTLEIMSPLPLHERTNRTIGQLVDILAEEWERDVENHGSTTLKYRGAERGFEPDSCFYFTNAVMMRGKDTIELPRDPAPELVVEIDLTSHSLDKLPLYAEMGVREVWRWVRDGLQILLLTTGGTYDRAEQSVVLEPLDQSTLEQFVRAARTERRPQWARSVRAWAQANVPGEE